MLLGITGGEHSTIGVTHDSLDFRLGQQDIRHCDIMATRAQELDVRCRVARFDIDHIRHQLVVHARGFYCLHQVVVVVVDIQNHLENETKETQCTVSNLTLATHHA